MSEQQASAVPVILMCCLVGMCLVIMSLFCISDPSAGRSPAHAEFSDTMYQSSLGTDRHTQVRWVGLAFALAQAIFFVVVLLLGTKQRGPLVVLFGLGGLAYAAAFIALVLAESTYAQGDVQSIVLGFPLPTAIMVYGVGGVPIFFSALYVLQFDRWVMRPEDLERVTKLAAERRQAEAGGSN